MFRGRESQVYGPAGAVASRVWEGGGAGLNGLEHQQACTLGKLNDVIDRVEVF